MVYNVVYSSSISGSIYYGLDDRKLKDADENFKYQCELFWDIYQKEADKDGLTVSI
jgi:hypothetical protein